MEKYLLRDELPSVCRYSRQVMRRMIKDGEFPCPIEVSPNRFAWKESEIQSWLDSRPRYEKKRSTGPASAEISAKLREAWMRRKARRNGEAA